MKIEVTQEDIDVGERWNWTQNPVSLAIRRCVGTALAVVDEEEIYYDGIDIDTPEVVKGFIYDFNINNPVQPFTFEL